MVVENKVFAKQGGTIFIEPSAVHGRGGLRHI